jgi:NADPH-dependent 2,4-dienoyl-CoA reductase/sulfur reductase-like enzyme
MTAGQAQKLVNYYGKLPGKKVVILGSGDIGLIMARRLTLEGAKVLKVFEIMSTSSGLARNIRQCLDDFDIPIHYNTTITEVIGEDRVTGIKYAQVDDKLNPIENTEKYLDCDLVVLSVGLAPEYDIVSNPHIDNRTGGLVVNELRECEEGVFACGNVLHVHDLVDNVTVESTVAGRNAALYALGKINRGKECQVFNGNGVRYTVPSTYYEGEGDLDIYFRINQKFLNSNIVVYSSGEEVFSKPTIALNPGEMECITIDKSKLKGDISVAIKER